MRDSSVGFSLHIGSLIFSTVQPQSLSVMVQSQKHQSKTKEKEKKIFLYVTPLVKPKVNQARLTLKHLPIIKKHLLGKAKQQYHLCKDNVLAVCINNIIYYKKRFDLKIGTSVIL